MKRTLPRRSGFTLIEILITITIIGILIALFLPALSAVRRNTRVAQIQSEIIALENALTDFKAKFGEYPPSQITIHKDQAGWNSDPRSRAIIARFWSQFDFSSDGAGGTFPFPAGQDSVRLDGTECLVFFLGGMRNSDLAFIGFSKSATRPFSQDGASRLGPFFDFATDRVEKVDSNGDGVFDDIDGDGFPMYFDSISSQSMPYLYLCDYNGRGYSIDDLDRDGDLTNASDRWMAIIYTQGASAGSAYKPSGFQIISAGLDREYGPGGVFSTDPKTASADLIGTRAVERDNITNFSGGTLVD